MGVKTTFQSKDYWGEKLATCSPLFAPVMLLKIEFTYLINPAKT